MAAQVRAHERTERNERDFARADVGERGLGSGASRRLALVRRIDLGVHEHACVRTVAVVQEPDERTVHNELVALLAALSVTDVGTPTIRTGRYPGRPGRPAERARASGCLVASRSAETIAAVETTVGGSPTPLTP